MKPGLFVKKGTTIHTEKPFIHVLSRQLISDRCDHCYSDYELLKCSGCHYVKYCDRNCQKLSWPDHKTECGNLKKLPSSTQLPDAARLLARIIMKLKRGGAQEKGFYNKNSFRIFKDLMSHYSDIKMDQKRNEHSVCLYEVLKDFLGEDNLPTYPEFVALYGRITVNSFNILDDEMGNLGTGIYLGASTIDHSCKPNAVATFVGTTIFIRTVCDIEDFKWSKVRIAYNETLKPREERNQELWSQYYFHCDCCKCDKEEKDRVVEQSLKCGSCSFAIDTEKEQIICSNCSWNPSDEILKKFLEVTNFIKYQHQAMNSIAYLDACKICLDKMDGLFHPDNILYIKTLDYAFDSSIQLQKWDDALLLAPKLISGYKRYYGEINPILGIHYLKYGKILLFRSFPDRALAMLEKSEEILKITHGPDHPLYRNKLFSLLLEAKSLVYNM